MIAFLGVILSLVLTLGSGGDALGSPKAIVVGQADSNRSPWLGEVEFGASPPVVSWDDVGTSAEWQEFHDMQRVGDRVYIVYNGRNMGDTLTVRNLRLRISGLDGTIIADKLLYAHTEENISVTVPTLEVSGDQIQYAWYNFHHGTSARDIVTAYSDADGNGFQYTVRGTGLSPRIAVLDSEHENPRVHIFFRRSISSRDQVIHAAYDDNGGNYSETQRTTANSHHWIWDALSVDGKVYVVYAVAWSTHVLAEHDPEGTAWDTTTLFSGDADDMRMSYHDGDLYYASIDWSGNLKFMSSTLAGGSFSSHTLKTGINILAPVVRIDTNDLGAFIAWTAYPADWSYLHLWAAFVNHDGSGYDEVTVSDGTEDGHGFLYAGIAALDVDGRIWARRNGVYVKVKAYVKREGQHLADPQVSRKIGGQWESQ